MRISLEEANGWNERTKLDLAELDADMLDQIETQVLAALVNSGYDVSTWVDDLTTPKLVRSVIAMLYIAWYYDKVYAEDAGEGNPYAVLLRQAAAAQIAGILDGTFVLEDDVLVGVSAGSPSFY